MIRKILTLSALMLLAVGLPAQNFEYKWQRVAMDTLCESDKIYDVDRIVANHQEQMAPLMEVVIYSDSEIVTKRPQSALSNLAADILYHTAKDYIDNDCPTFSLTNFGGIRNNFPKGAIRVYDVYATFPFDNSLVIAQLRGNDVRKMIEKFVRRNKFEALGGIEIEVRRGELEKCLIEGHELKEDGIYNLATIDFLLDGGDRFYIKDKAVSIKRTGIVIRDAATAYLRGLSRNGVVLSNKTDGRIKFK